MFLQAEQPDHSASSTSAYRAYEIGEDGKVRTSTDIIASSDDDALSQMRRMTNGRVWELWDRSRLVKRLASNDKH